MLYSNFSASIFLSCFCLFSLLYCSPSLSIYLRIHTFPSLRASHRLAFFSETGLTLTKCVIFPAATSIWLLLKHLISSAVQTVHSKVLTCIKTSGGWCLMTIFPDNVGWWSFCSPLWSSSRGYGQHEVGCFLCVHAACVLFTFSSLPLMLSGGLYSFLLFLFFFCLI